MKNPPQSRLFIAISLPPSTKEFLRKLQGEIRQELPGMSASWPKPERMHLTLKFLGETPKDKIPAIQSAMAEAASQHPCFQLQAGGVGLFPSVKKPRVLWSGVKGDMQRLSRLHATLEKELQRCGFPKEKRRFSPHFTLARLKGRNNPRRFLELISKYQRHTAEPFHCDFFQLFESELKSSGAVHTPLFHMSLKQS